MCHKTQPNQFQLSSKFLRRNEQNNNSLYFALKQFFVNKIIFSKSKEHTLVAGFTEYQLLLDYFMLKSV